MRIFGSKILLCAATTMLLTACFSSKSATSTGGEVTGASGASFSEPAPFGMVRIDRGSLKMGIEKKDSLWDVRLR